MVKQLVIIARLFRARPEDGAVDANLTEKQQQPAVLTDGSTCFTDLMCKTVERMSGPRVQTRSHWCQFKFSRRGLKIARRGGWSARNATLTCYLCCDFYSDPEEQV